MAHRINPHRYVWLEIEMRSGACQILDGCGSQQTDTLLVCFLIGTPYLPKENFGGMR